MGFNRTLLPLAFKSGEELTRDLAGIGILLATSRSDNPNIEDTLLAASREGMAGDLRTLGLIINWLEVHLPFVNADRLLRALKLIKDERILAFWVAIAQHHKSDRRFGALSRKCRGKHIKILPSQSNFLITRHGEDPRFSGTCLIVPRRTLRDRPQDILNPKQLADIHHTYRHRIIMGPSYRADMWAELEKNPELPTAELARRCYGSFATAWKVIEDRKLIAA